MYAIEFEAPIENGIVHIPKEYQDLELKKAKIIVMYDNKQNSFKKLDEFRSLRKESNNKIKANMDLVNDIDGLVDDGIF